MWPHVHSSYVLFPPFNKIQWISMTWSVIVWRQSQGSPGPFLQVESISSKPTFLLENLRGCGLGGFECDEVFESKISVLNGFESIQLKMTMQTFRSRDFANISLFLGRVLLVDIMRRRGLEWWVCWEALRDQDCLGGKALAWNSPQNGEVWTNLALAGSFGMGATPQKKTWEPAQKSPKIRWMEKHLSNRNSHFFPSETPICINHP